MHATNTNKAHHNLTSRRIADVTFREIIIINQYIFISEYLICIYGLHVNAVRLRKILPFHKSFVFSCDLGVCSPGRDACGPAVYTLESRIIYPTVVARSPFQSGPALLPTQIISPTVVPRFRAVLRRSQAGSLLPPLFPVSERSCAAPKPDHFSHCRRAFPVSERSCAAPNPDHFSHSRSPFQSGPAPLPSRIIAPTVVPRFRAVLCRSQAGSFLPLSSRVPRFRAVLCRSQAGSLLPPLFPVSERSCAAPKSDHCSHCHRAFPVSERSCAAPKQQRYGHQMNCDGDFPFGSTCAFECDDGYELPSNGTSEVTCIVTTLLGSENLVWDATPTSCEGRWAETAIWKLSYGQIIVGGVARGGSRGGTCPPWAAPK